MVSHHSRTHHTPAQTHPYGVLIGHPIQALEEQTTASPHYQIHLKTQEAQPDYRIAVNVRSDEQPYNLLYYLNDTFAYANLTDLLKLTKGFTALDRSNALAIDFLRSNIFDQGQMTPVPFTNQGTASVLESLLDARVKAAIDTSDSLIFAFGRHWGPEEAPDQIFDFVPGQGIHDIHMNQGSGTPHENENGIYQDGALMIYTPSKDQLIALFLMFQSQSVKTDCQGNPARQLIEICN